MVTCFEITIPITIERHSNRTHDKNTSFFPYVPHDRQRTPARFRTAVNRGFTNEADSHPYTCPHNLVVPRLSNSTGQTRAYPASTVFEWPPGESGKRSRPPLLREKGSVPSYRGLARTLLQLESHVSHY